MIDLRSATTAQAQALGLAGDLPTVAPSSASALGEALASASADGRRVVPWGGGTEQRLGAPPARCDLLLLTTDLRGVDFYTPEDLTLGVAAGTTLAEIDQVLRARGQFLPLDLPAPDSATIGGVVATAASPVRRLRYGGVRDLVIGVQVAQADGTLCKAGGRVVKNVAGYDLCKLYSGSLGTLGVLASVNLKVQPLPRRQAAIEATFDLPADAFGVAARIAATGLGYGAVVVAGSPGGGCTLTALAEGFAGAVAEQQAFAASAIAMAGGWIEIREGREAADATVRALADWRLGPIADPASESLLLRCSLSPSTLRNAPGALTAALAPLAPSIEWQADAALGIIWVRMSGNVAAHPEYVQAALAAARHWAQSAGGHLVIARGSASLRRSVDPWGAPRDGEKLARALKQQLDPGGILNPGRFAYGI